MDAGAHAIGRAELGHPHEHVDAQFLRPGQVDRKQDRIQEGNADEIAVHHRDEDDEASPAPSASRSVSPQADRGFEATSISPYRTGLRHARPGPAPFRCVRRGRSPRACREHSPDRRKAASAPTARKPASNVYALVGRAPRLLEEFVDQRLADALCHILVNRFERLAHRRILLRRQRDDLALAGLLDLGERVVVFLGATGRCRIRWLPSWPFRIAARISAGRPSQNFLFTTTT